MRAIILFLFLFSSCIPLLAGTQEEIEQAEENLRQAFLHADPAALNRLLVDDWTTVHVNGRKQSKASFIDAVQSGRVKFLSIAIDDREVRVYGETVVTVARWSNSIEFKGQRKQGQDRITTVWMKRPSGWQSVAQQAAFMEDAKAPPGPAYTADDEKEILRLEKVIVDAWLKHDVATVSAIVADDVEYWSFKGKRRGKADMLKNVEKNGETDTKMDDQKVRVFGDTAIYTALITDTGKDEKGAPFSATTAVTIVYVRRDGKWQMVQDHESLLQK